jgi:2',3'-cyclic-nucleotide 2'-phosphodiesterase (5'-nucleotidase family)
MPDATVTAKPILLIQLNDLYHIDTRADYTDQDSLVLPRIATLTKRLRDFYGNDWTRFCVPGDFLAPSCLSKEFKGKQMVQVMNLMGVDLVSLGNHEFEADISQADLEARMNESRFEWLNLNFAFHDAKFERGMVDAGKMSSIHIIRPSATHAVAIFGVLGAETPEHLGRVIDQYEMIKELSSVVAEVRNELKASTVNTELDFSLVAMTHQTVEEDCKLAKSFPELRLVMGGHDHNVVVRELVDHCLVVKTASNARTTRFNWIVTIPRRTSSGEPIPDRRTDATRFEKFAKDLFFETGLKPLRDALLGTRTPTNEQLQDLANVFGPKGLHDYEVLGRPVGEDYVFTFSLSLATGTRSFTRLLPPDVPVQTCIETWNLRSSHLPDQLALTPCEVVLLDCEIRRKSTNFGNFVADVLLGIPTIDRPDRWDADVAIINSGSFRIDRNLQTGEVISDRTLCDIFYHSNEVRSYTISGAALLAVLHNALALRNRDANEGDGNFVQIAGLRVRAAATITEVEIVDRQGIARRINPAEAYRVATTSYVATKAFGEHFEGCASTPLDTDIRERVRDALTRLAPAELEKLLATPVRWIFSGPMELLRN